MLEEIGHARSADVGGRKVFQITDEGREDLADHRHEVEDFYDRAGGSGDWEVQAEIFADLAAGVTQLFRLYKRAARRGALSNAAKKAIRSELTAALERIEKIIEKD
jgi:DNA-binding PadR family transcriptional regulator